MGKAQIAYKEVPGADPRDARKGKVGTLKRFQEIHCNVIFDVKMNFIRKARLVADGSRTETTVSVCYSSVVSRDSVRLALLVTTLHDLDVFACGIGNAYLNAPCNENIWFVAGTKCSKENQSKGIKLVRALYGLTSSGALQRKMFKDYIIDKLGFTSYVMDGDMYYMRNATDTGEPYYELLLVYMDDVLAINCDPESIMK